MSVASCAYAALRIDEAQLVNCEVTLLVSLLLLISCAILTNFGGWQNTLIFVLFFIVSTRVYTMIIVA